MEKLSNTTLVYLVKRLRGEITDICLAMKKRGFGVNRWNGVGGKVDEQNETIEDAAKRETEEEIGVFPKKLNKVAELSFYFPHNPEWDQLVYVYFSDDYEGEPTESKEMRPQWFSAAGLPFKDMWPDDEFWMPEVLKGNLLKATFKFGKNDVIQDKKIDIIDNFQIS